MNDWKEYKLGDVAEKSVLSNGYFIVIAGNGRDRSVHRKCKSK